MYCKTKNDKLTGQKPGKLYYTLTGKEVLLSNPTI